MKGIILAGGTGSRLFPLTKITNKHLLPVGKYTMIEHVIAKMKLCNIKNIMIICEYQYISSITKLLGSGYNYGVNFTFRIQDCALGIAQALGLCEDFVNKDKCLVMLGDNIFNDNIQKYVSNFENQKSGAKILLKKVDDPTNFGVAEISSNKILSIEEKPKKPKSNYCVTGIYMYDSKVFNIIKSLTPSYRGELEITDVNNWYIKHDLLTYDILENWWLDAGTFDSLFYANQLLKDTNLNNILYNTV